MDVSFNRINSELEKIVDDFKVLLDSGNYKDAKDAVNGIMDAFKYNSGIELTNGEGSYDNRFHELYDKLIKELNSRAGSPAKATSGSFKALELALQNASRDFFNTSKVRSELIKKDPNLDEYKKALEEGIKEAKARKETLENQKVVYGQMQEKIIPATEKDVLDNENTNYEQIDKVIEDIKKIKDDLNWINGPAHAAATFDAEKNRRKGNVSTLKNDLKSKLEYLNRSKGLDISKFGVLDDFFEDSNITSGNAEKIANDVKNSQITPSLKTKYDAILKRLKDAQAGAYVVKDADGNDVNLANEEVIKNANLSTIDLTIDFESGKKEIDNVLFKIASLYKNIDKQIDVANLEKEIFEEHKKVIDLENDLLSRDVNNRDEYIRELQKPENKAVWDDINDEYAKKAADSRDKFYGSKEKHKEYKQAWKRFKSHRTTSSEHYTCTEIWLGDHTHIQNLQISYEYDTINDYPEKDKDLDFMQVTTWEDRSKRSSRATALIEAVRAQKADLSADDISRIVAKAYGDETLEQLDAAYHEIMRRSTSGSGSTGPYGTPADQDEINAIVEQITREKQRILLQYERDKDYVKNYNSAHFDVKDTVAVALTGGSAIRARSNQSKANLTLGGAMGALFGVTSYARKADGKRHILRTTIANAFGIVSTPVRALKVAMGVTIGGITAIGGKITGTYDMPTPYRVGYLDRREARLEYYRNNGSSRIGAWFKSLFNGKVKDENGKMVKVNDKIIADRCAEIRESIEDKYIRSARDKLIDEKIAAERNRRARAVAYKEQARSAEMYEDIFINNPESIDADPAKKEEMMRRAIQRGILGLGDSKNRKVTHIDESFVPGGGDRSDKFKVAYPVNQEEIDALNQFDMRNITGKSDFSETIGETIWTNAISRENIQRAKTRGMDATLRIASAATLPVIKHFLSKYMVKFVKEPDEVVPDEVIQETEHYTVYGQRPIYGDVTKEIPTQTTEYMSSDNLTFGDLIRGKDAHWCADLDKYQGPHASGLFSNSATEIQAAHFDFTDPLTGKHFDFSFSPTRYKQYIDSHNLNEFSTEYHDVVSFADGDNIVDSVVAHMPKETGEAYRRFLEEASKTGTFKDAFESSTQFAYGIPGASMGQGWSVTSFGDASRIVEGTKTITMRDIIGYESYPIDKTRVVDKVIKGYIKEGAYVEVPGETGKVMGLITGAMLIPDAIKQALSPVFRRGQRLTKNHKKTYDNGDLIIGDEIDLGKNSQTFKQRHMTLKDGQIFGRNDIYESPLDDSSVNGSKIGKPLPYEHDKLAKDSALHTIKHNGDPIICIVTDKNGNTGAKIKTYSEDDFEL